MPRRHAYLDNAFSHCFGVPLMRRDMMAVTFVITRRVNFIALSSDIALRETIIRCGFIYGIGNRAQNISFRKLCDNNFTTRRLHCSS